MVVVPYPTGEESGQTHPMGPLDDSHAGATGMWQVLGVL